MVNIYKYTSDRRLDSTSFVNEEDSKDVAGNADEDELDEEEDKDALFGTFVCAGGVN